jgi:hypothetical protein
MFPLTEPVVSAVLEAGSPLAQEPDSPLASGNDSTIIKLPVNLNASEMGHFRSPGYKNMPCSFEPLSPENEVDSLLV